jgi:cysteine desulfurase
MTKRVYLDYASATPLDPRVREAMMPFLTESFGNPSSLHETGMEAKNAVEEARLKVANLIRALPEEVIFTSSGSEANNLAILGLARAQSTKGRHLIVSAVEHFSVLHPAGALEEEGWEVTRIPVDPFGRVDPSDVEKAIRKDTVLLSIQHANSEVGTIQSLAEIGKIAKDRGGVFHTDAIAAVGTIPVNVQELNADALSLAAGMFYGPKGAGALYLRHGTRIRPLITGGIQEGGRRAGTEDVAAIAGMGKACELAEAEMGERAQKVRPLRDKLEKLLLENIDHLRVNGHPEQRLPGYLSVCVEYVEGESILLHLNMQGIHAASGSACTANAFKKSHVLLAIGIPPETAQGSLLFTLGRDNSEEDVQKVASALPPIVAHLRAMSPLYPG